MDTISLILNKLAPGFNYWDVDEAKISYRTFATILFSKGSPQYDSERTVKEKWRQLQYMGLLKMLNGYVGAFDLNAVRHYLTEDEI